MREFTLVDCETGLIYGPHRTCPMARTHAEVEAIATREIFTDGDALVDWNCPETARVYARARHHRAGRCRNAEAVAP